MVGLAQLMQFADSGFPIGGYAFSFGLEAAAQLPALQSEEGLERYIRLYARQLVAGDWPFVLTAWEAPCAEASARVVAAYDAFLLGPGPRRASLTLGHNFMRVLKPLHPEVEPLFASYRKNQWPRHYTPLFGGAMGLLGCEQKPLFDLYLFCAVRDQLSAAIRLNRIGPLAASAMQSRLLRGLDALYEQAPHDLSAATRPAPFVEMMQLCQPQLYSRLFQS